MIEENKWGEKNILVTFVKLNGTKVAQFSNF